MFAGQEQTNRTIWRGKRIYFLGRIGEIPLHPQKHGHRVPTARPLPQCHPAFCANLRGIDEQIGSAG